MLRGQRIQRAERLVQRHQFALEQKGAHQRHALAHPAGKLIRVLRLEGEIAAWRLVIGWEQEAGRIPSTDPAGNLFLTLPGLVALRRRPATWSSSPG
ncbi:MAG: hypothetical protein WDN49_26200 [Acetobacteraceae bacterium]